MTDKETVEALVRHDAKVTAQFFYKDCRPLFLSVIKRVFDKQIVDYDEIISELYILLMEDDAKRLRQFNFESTLYQWLKVTAIRHCLKLKAQQRVIADESQEPVDVVQALIDYKVDVILINLPTGSAQAARYYVECAKKAKCGVVNGIPEFLASDPAVAEGCKEAGIPIL